MARAYSRVFFSPHYPVSRSLSVSTMAWACSHQFLLPLTALPPGHYLSASAMAWASTHNASLKEKMEHLVDELDTCQQKIGSGYLSAFPSELFDRFEAIQPVWAPYYTIHKVSGTVYAAVQRLQVSD